jgi:DNA polymerase (family 10)
MDNYQIADALSLLAKLMDIHGENEFKSKSYAAAAFALEKFPQPVAHLPVSEIAAIKGIGQSSAQKIDEYIRLGKIQALEEWIAQTPPGVIEMLQIKGIGPKKIHTIWKEMQIESIGELWHACKENRLKRFKGFGEKTQQNVMESIQFFQQHKDHHLYAAVYPLVEHLQSFFQKLFPQQRLSVTGDFRRQLDVIESLDFLIEGNASDVQATLNMVPEFTLVNAADSGLQYQTGMGLTIRILTVDAAAFAETLLRTSSSESFYLAWKAKAGTKTGFASEEACFTDLGLPVYPCFYREDAATLNHPAILSKPCIQQADIRGIIHSHSQWSDGSNTLEEMAVAAQAAGLEYLVISDHSQSAFYANGLSVERIKAQHAEIDRLNAKLQPFKIFKSIEADILNDGSLDYSDQILSTFDLVIASVHSNLKMSEEKAMLRLMKAIENPYTTILGHLTGRLLLSRPGYPVDHDAIIDACARHQVVIELNANPNRLDMDWRFIGKALEKNVLISIDPDAHEVAGYQDNFFGVQVAQKAWLQPHQNLSSFSLDAFEQFLEQQRNKR